MIFAQILSALISLKRNILRSLLTMLGIVIGVAVVITMMEIGAGASASVRESLANMGTNVLMIWPAATKTAGISSGSGGRMTLSEGDCDAIREECLAVEAVSPSLGRRGIQAIAGNLNWTPMTVYSGSVDYFTVQSWGLPESGRYFTAREVETAACVCVLGQTVRDELFPDTDPVGSDIRLNNVLFRVVGVLPKKGANMMGMDQDDVVIIPWKTMRNRLSRNGASAMGGAGGSSSSSSESSTDDVYPASSATTYPEKDSVQAENYILPVRFDNVDQITCSARTPEQVSDAIEQISAVLRRRHGIAPGQPDDFMIRDMTQMLKTMSGTSQLMTTLLLIVAMLSLVVGGVGIMNIMLVSVTERTREIGLRMAVGARGSRILSQFLTESVLLCLMGGCVGIGFGRLASMVISAVLGWPVKVSLSAILVSAGVAAAIGVIFGFYPAWRASRLNPIDALRHE